MIIFFGIQWNTPSSKVTMEVNVCSCMLSGWGMTFKNLMKCLQLVCECSKWTFNSIILGHFTITSMIFVFSCSFSTKLSITAPYKIRHCTYWISMASLVYGAMWTACSVLCWIYKITIYNNQFKFNSLILTPCYCINVKTPDAKPIICCQKFLIGYHKFFTTQKILSDDLKFLSMTFQKMSSVQKILYIIHFVDN